jgi:hypothetical protein
MYTKLGEITREELLNAKPGVIQRIRIPTQQTLKKYGITPATYTDILRRQNFVCGICEDVNFLVIDQCHETNKVRGLLCNRCNIGMGFIDAGLAMKSLVYKERFVNSY